MKLLFIQLRKKFNIVTNNIYNKIYEGNKIVVGFEL